MAPRAYNNQTRLLQQEALKARIAEAAARLHKAQGALATSHAQIAEEAGVSLPTVYKHYPTLDDMVRACTAHVASLAPPFPAERIMQAPDLASAAKALVATSDAMHRHFAPWMVWREQGRIPALADVVARERAQTRAFCQAVLERHLGPGEHRAAAAWWEALLSFETRESVLSAPGQSRASFRETLVHLLLAVAGPQRDGPTSQRPTRRN